MDYSVLRPVSLEVAHPERFINKWNTHTKKLVTRPNSLATPLQGHLS